MSLEKDLADANARRAHIIDMIQMGEADCTACRAGRIAGAVAILTLVAVLYMRVRKVRHDRA